MLAYTRKNSPDVYYKINNQSIYNSAIRGHSRRLFVGNMHEYIKNEIKSQIKPQHITNLSIIKKFPVKLEFTFYTVVNHGGVRLQNESIHWKEPAESYQPNWDIENLATIWIKVFNDVLVELCIIPDDNVKYVKGISYTFVPVKSFDKRKIVVNIK